MTEESPEAVERRRGHTDALAGHGPALFDGPYMVGYRRGRAEIGRPMEHLPAKGEDQTKVLRREWHEE